jgi:hypothetical protein
MPREEQLVVIPLQMSVSRSYHYRCRRKRNNATDELALVPSIGVVTISYLLVTTPIGRETSTLHGRSASAFSQTVLLVALTCIVPLEDNVTFFRL